MTDFAAHDAAVVHKGIAGLTLVNHTPTLYAMHHLVC